jgi:PTH1 family peptidyl-tRNA hydrolase
VKFIFGLGNPGTQYSKTRHNVGFLFLDHLARKHALEFKAGKGKYIYSVFTLNNEEIYLIKPSTYMNLSGDAIVQFLNTFASNHPKTGEKNILPLINQSLIVYDDFNLPIGKVRFRPKGTDGGHNGIKSIIYRLNSDVFPRLRIGINAPVGSSIVDYVLGEFSTDDLIDCHLLFLKLEESISLWQNEGFDRVMNIYN